MPPRKKTTQPASQSDELWLSSKPNIKGIFPEREWSGRAAAPQSSRLLELADIALGVKKKEVPKRRAAAASGTKQ